MSEIWELNAALRDAGFKMDSRDESDGVVRDVWRLDADAGTRAVTTHGGDAITLSLDCTRSGRHFASGEESWGADELGGREALRRLVGRFLCDGGELCRTAADSMAGRLFGGLR